MDKTEYRFDAAKAVLLNKYRNCKPVLSKKEYPVYFEYDYGVDPLALHTQMIQEGYLDKPSIKDILQTYKISDLKTLLESMGESPIGRKQALIDRALMVITDEDAVVLRDSFDKYSLTASGQSYVDCHKEYILLRKHLSWGLELDDYIKTKESLGFDGDFYDVMWRYFNSVILQGDYHMFPSVYYNMGECCREREQNESALIYYLYSVYYDISGFENYGNIDLFFSGHRSKGDLRRDYIDPCPAPAKRKRVFDLKDYYNPEMASEVFRHSFCKYSYRLCDEEHFIMFINEIINNIPYDQKKWTNYFFEQHKQCIWRLN